MEFRVQGSGLWNLGSEFWVLGFGFSVQCSVFSFQSRVKVAVARETLHAGDILESLTVDFWRLVVWCPLTFAGVLSVQFGEVLERLGPLILEHIQLICSTTNEKSG